MLIFHDCEQDRECEDFRGRRQDDGDEGVLDDETLSKV
jgi:hypothetical protein